ncbi:MAG TPA: M20/M25/M40 family metallo-hydrolase, partial [Thermomicrobiales bacterium]|nr:M20/M25/M40 family metallo-hydrolase [Thermomicrobiales bacterium]
GLRVERQEVTPHQDNVLVTLDVPNATGTLLFEAHMDTVALEPMGEDALRPVVRDGRLYGRGACDTKGSMASMMVALERLRDRREELAANVALLAAVDEEHAFTGVLRYIASDAEATAAVVGEPTELQLVVAHKGCVRGDIRVVGKAAHSSEPHRGASAIDAMADVLVALRTLPQRIQLQSHPLLGSPTFSVGLIEGGAGVNVVPETCTITYDRRTLPRERTTHVLEELDTVLDEVRGRRQDVRIERPEPRLADEGLDTPVDTPFVRAASDACRAAGADGTPVGVPYGTDASKLQDRRGIPAVVFGPGSIAQAHGAGEYVPIDHLHRAVEVYEGIALRYSPEGRGQA